MHGHSTTPRAAGRPREGERGFTLLELVVAMTVFGLIGLGIFGVLVLGARSAGSGERVTEQARRYRVANDVITRQIAAAEPIQLPRQDEDGLSSDEEGSSAEPFFLGDVETLEFVTTAPQRPDASGMAIVNYWLEDGTLKMSESPVFSAYGTGKGLDRADTEDTVATVLLYDVESVTFSYQRESDTDEWLETWDATEDNQLPACVRIDVRPSAVGGPDFYHEIPVMVGAMNQIADVDEDFRALRSRRGTTEEEDTGQVRQPEPEPEEDDDGDSPGATLPDDDEDEE
jgi:general secretion pathway protein J